MAEIIEMRTGERIEQRSELRRRALKRAVLSFYGGYCTLDAVIRSQSHNGARLDFTDTTDVPAEFSLAVAGEAGKRMAKVCWRSPVSVGVRLLQQ